MPSSASQSTPVSRRRSRSISDVERAAICRYQRRHPTVTKVSVVAWAQEELGVTVNRNTVSRVLKKAAYGRAMPTQILNNILDEYSNTIVSHNSVQAGQQNAQDIDTSTEVHVATNGMNEVSPGNVQKYLQAWISHLHSIDDPERDHLLQIAEKHLQILETSILNTKIQTTIHSYFKQVKI